MTKINLNNDLNGIEIIFDAKPNGATLEGLKAYGFRWHNVKKLWYAKQTPERIAYAESISNGEPIAAPTPVNKSVYILAGEEKENFITQYNEVKTAKDDGTSHQFTRGGWLKYYRDKDYIFFKRLGLCVSVARPGIYNQIWYDDEREDPIKGNNKKTVFMNYNIKYFSDFWAEDWKKSKKELEEIGCTTGRYNERPALLEYKRNGEPSEVYIYFTTLTDNYDLEAGRATAHELTPEEVEELLQCIDTLRNNYITRLENYYKRYEKNIHSSGYWANR